MRVYLDYAATTPMVPVVQQAMRPFFAEHFGNPAATHAYGRAAMAAVDVARSQVKTVLAADYVGQIIFTSGATESNALVVLSFLQAATVEDPIHVVTTAVEHASIRSILSHIDPNRIFVTHVPVDATGRVAPDAVLQSLTPQTKLVSIQYVNNETGVIQPIAEITRCVRSYQSEHGTKIFVHTDAAQAAAYPEQCNLDVAILGVDALTLSGHKVYGPKGVGVLYVQNPKKLTPLYHGGGQEYGLRPGTVATPLVVGCGAALNQTRTREYLHQMSQVKLKRIQWIEQLRAVGSERIEIVEGKHQVPGILSMRLRGISNQISLVLLDQLGIAASAGSACAAGAHTPSVTLQAMGFSPTAVTESIRCSFGIKTTEEELTFATAALRNILNAKNED